MNTTRCKFRLTEIRSHKSNVKAEEQKTYVFHAQYDPGIPDDKRFCQYTPNGRVDIVVTNPEAQEMFVHGADFYFDISPVPPTDSTPPKV